MYNTNIFQNVCADLWCTNVTVMYYYIWISARHESFTAIRNATLVAASHSPHPSLLTTSYQFLTLRGIWETNMIVRHWYAHTLSHLTCLLRGIDAQVLEELGKWPSRRFRSLHRIWIHRISSKTADVERSSLWILRKSNGNSWTLGNGCYRTLRIFSETRSTRIAKTV